MSYEMTFVGDIVKMFFFSFFGAFNSEFNKSLTMKWYFLFRIQHAGHSGITKHTPFYDLIRCFQYSIRVTTTGNRKTVLPLYVLFSTIKTRNSTIHFSFFFFGSPHSTRRSHTFSAHTKKFKLLRHACKCVGVVFIILCIQERVPRVIPFRLSKTNQADHMCLGAPSFWSAVYA